MKIGDYEELLFFEVEGCFIGDGLWYHGYLGGQYGQLLTYIKKEYVDDEFQVKSGKYPDAQEAEAWCKAFTGFGIFNYIGNEYFEDDACGYGEEDVADDPHDELYGDGYCEYFVDT